MAARAEFIDFPVEGATLGALRWAGLSGAPTVVAVHGITSNAWVWDPLAHHLAGAAELVAVDLRGRGRSFDAAPPYGIGQHAADIASIVDQLGGPLVLLGHSMGAFVVELVAERHPRLVRDLLLVDGGAPLAAPTDGDVDAFRIERATKGGPVVTAGIDPSQRDIDEEPLDEQVAEDLAATLRRVSGLPTG